MNFASLRQEIAYCINRAGKLLAAPELMDECKLAVSKDQIAQTLFSMCAAGELAKHPAPEGAGKGVRFIYGPGKAKPDAAAPQIYPTGSGRVTAKPRTKKPRKVRAVKRHKRGKTAAKSVLLMKKETVFQGVPFRWALTSDGAFMLLGTQTEIQKPAARALVDFVRALDGGAA